jgi:hypothetical protein
MKDILALFRRDAELDPEHQAGPDHIGNLVERTQMLGVNERRQKKRETERRPEHPVYGRR